MTNKEYEARKKRIELENRDLRQKQKLKELKNKYLKHSLPGMADKSSQNAPESVQNAPESILTAYWYSL